MTQATHTQGPWLLTFGTNDAAIHNGGTIAMTDDTMMGWKSNAALIAAAPDLLAALEQALPIIDAYRRVSGGDGDIVAMNTRAVIAKAKGN